MEIDYDLIENLSRDEIVDLYEEKTRQISDLYAERRPLEHRIRLLMEEEGTTTLKTESSIVKLSPQKSTQLSQKMVLGLYDEMGKFISKLKQDVEHQSESTLVSAPINKDKGAALQLKLTGALKIIMNSADTRTPANSTIATMQPAIVINVNV